MCDIVVKKVTFAISSPDEFLFQLDTQIYLGKYSRPTSELMAGVLDAFER